MEHSRPLLTIAIPTYNRAAFLSDLLESLFVQVEKYSEVELIISDNHSTDMTQEVIRSYKARGLKITAHRNAENIGADRNFLKLFNAAKGKYFWLIGDDERLMPHTLAKLLPILHAGEHDMLWVNSYGYTEDGQNVEAPIRSEPPVVYEDSEKYAAAVRAQFTFISANIINLECLEASGKINYSEGVGSYMIQLYWTYPNLNTMRSAVCVQEYLLITRSYKTSGWGACQVMGVNSIIIARKLISSKATVRILERDILCKWLPDTLLRMKMPDYPLNQELPHKILGPYWAKDPLYWMCVYPISVLPLWFAKPWRFLVRAMYKAGRSLQMLG